MVCRGVQAGLFFSIEAERTNINMICAVPLQNSEVSIFAEGNCIGLTLCFSFLKVGPDRAK